jgi:tetratricopeptide (TPR) repeat protein
MPVTLFSHMLDCQLFHMESGMHHLDNVLLHILATLLLFAVLKRATQARWPSAFVALIFAVHPLHVESVAWVAERKDVLSACFWFLAWYGYLRYVERPSLRSYLLVAVPFALGLMAKPMLVTFPFTLFLLDFWPLKRVSVIEKLPLIAMSAADACVTFLVQKSTAAVQSYPLPVRIENAMISYVTYLGQMFWPARLSVLYPYQQSPELWQAIAAGIILAAVTASVICTRRSYPYLAVGWFWYLGTLVPVIGIVQVGLQSYADRYMYIPMIGLLIMLAWGARDLLRRWPAAMPALVVAAAACGTGCMSLAYLQTAYWQNSGTLFERALQVTRNNYVAEYNLANYLMNSSRGVEAIPHFEAALRIRPDYPEAQNNLGMTIGNIPGRMPEAISHFEAAVRLKPDLLQAHYNLAVALEQTPGGKAEALKHYQFIERLQPSPEIEAIIKRLQ